MEKYQHWQVSFSYFAKKSERGVSQQHFCQSNRSWSKYLAKWLQYYLHKGGPENYYSVPRIFGYYIISIDLTKRSDLFLIDKKSFLGGMSKWREKGEWLAYYLYNVYHL